MAKDKDPSPETSKMQMVREMMQLHGDEVKPSFANAEIFAKYKVDINSAQISSYKSMIKNARKQKEKAAKKAQKGLSHDSHRAEAKNDVSYEGSVPAFTGTAHENIHLVIVDLINDLQPYELKLGRQILSEILQKLYPV